MLAAAALEIYFNFKLNCKQQSAIYWCYFCRDFFVLAVKLANKTRKT